MARNLLQAIRQLRPEIGCEPFRISDLRLVQEAGQAAYVYVPSSADRQGMTPDLVEAQIVLQQCSRLARTKFVLLSSALIYGTGPGRQSLVTESYSNPGKSRRVADQWKSLEELAGRFLRGKVRLTILRLVTVIPSAALLARRLAGRFTLTIAGYDPVMQLLSLPDLAQAVLRALEQEREGAFNVAPDAVVPLNAAIRLAGKHRIALPLRLQRMAGAEELEYLRYPWTVSNSRIKQELGFSPKQSSVAALLETDKPDAVQTTQDFDEFGLDKDSIQTHSRGLFRFLCNSYWRIETKGMEHIPREGPAVLVGMHRGFVPMDGVMVVHLVMRETGNVPRFLTHPGLLKLPFIAKFVARMGGVIACEESADRVLESGGLLGVFPEGVDGAFALRRQAYQLRDFGRDSFAKLALRHRAPIIPFVVVGSAEIFPIFARIKSRRWKRWTDWPWLPLSTFPMIPFPLPSKWHIQFLAPIRVEEYSAESGRRGSLAKVISADVRARMQSSVDEMVQRRRSIFFGSVFNQAGGPR